MKDATQDFNIYDVDLAESIFKITYIGSQTQLKNKSKKIDDMSCNSDSYIFYISKKLFTCLGKKED